MGREWYFGWGSSKSSTKKGGVVKDGRGRKGGGNGGGDETLARPQVAAAAAAAGGCMNAMLHMFDFHHLHLCLHSQSSSYLSDDPSTLSKGLEAPRNSLEEFHNTPEKRNFSLNFPTSIQNKTNRKDARLKLIQAPRYKVEDILSENTCSPATRTPTLVARLMGLDILPESNNTTPRSSSSSSTKARKKNTFNNDTPRHRSPPESPRSSTSSSQKRSRNVVEKHRLSLQIEKESNIVKEMELSRPSCSAINTKRRDKRRYEDENKSPGYYARQIMKQVKETVSRRVGADITNTVEHRDLRRDEHLLGAKTPTKSKKSRLNNNNNKSSEVSQKVSEKLRALEVPMCDVQEDVPKMGKLRVKQKDEKHYRTDNVDKSVKSLGSVVSTKSCSKMPPKSYESIKNKKDEQFVRPQTRSNDSATEKNCKKTTLFSDLVHGSVPSIVPLKKKIVPPQAHHPKLLQEEGLPKAQMTKLIDTPTRYSRSPGQPTYEKIQEATQIPANHDKEKDSATISSSIEEFRYISRILKCTGIDRDTPINLTKWFSPSHPLNPTIYHSLEISHYHTSKDINQTRPPINRKLIFDLVDEILAEILKPKNNQQHHINGLQLVKTMCKKIQSFPSSNCQTLQDIDALIENDMSKLGTMSNLAMFEEECNTIVTEIEHDIVDSIVQEMALFCSGSS